MDFDFVCTECYRHPPEVVAFIQDNLISKECSHCGASADSPVAASMAAVAEYINSLSEPRMCVCGACITNPGIVEFIRCNAFAEQCSFCSGRDSTPIAAPIDEVGQYINYCLNSEYDDAANQLPYESREGGYLWDHWDTWDLLFDEHALDLPNETPEGNLTSALLQNVDDKAWCAANAIRGTEREQATYNWDYFCWVTMHQRRFFFSEYDGSDHTVDRPSETLSRIFELAQHTGLFTELPQGSRLFRARREEGNEPFQSAQELGPPPQEKATQSNRMSPAGIVMFYGSEEKETALRETADSAGKFAVGTFETLRPAKILDLSHIPPTPSLFEAGLVEGGFLTRKALIFLRHVAEQISRRIERDGREHVEYVPTQVVTEYIRSQFVPDGSSIDGIKFASSVHQGGSSYVLFATQSNIYCEAEGESSGDRWLRLLKVEQQSIDASFLARMMTLCRFALESVTARIKWKVLRSSSGLSASGHGDEKCHPR